MSTEVEKLDREWRAVSGDLNEAHRAQLHLTAFLDRVKGVEEERNSENWTPALQSIAASAGPDIELRVIHIWKNPMDAQGRVLRIEGFSDGQGAAHDCRSFLPSVG